MPDVKTSIIKGNATVYDTVALIKKAALLSRDSKAVKELLLLAGDYKKAPNKLKWFENLFWVIDSKTYYKFDEINKEQVKSAEVLLVKQKYGDCDDYSVLWGAILHNLGIPFEIKIVKYSMSGGWKHVYVTATIEGGKKIVLDSVVGKFRKTFNKEVDFEVFEEFRSNDIKENKDNMSGLQLEYLEGIESAFNAIGCPPTAGATRKREIFGREIDNKPITKAELFKLHIEIDRQVMREASLRLRGSKAKEYKKAAERLTDIINSPIKDESITNALSGLGFLKIGKVVSKVASVAAKVVTLPQRAILQAVAPAVAQKVDQTIDKAAGITGKVAEAAYYATNKLTKLPARGMIMLVLDTLAKKKASKAFLYSFIPEGSPILSENPKIAEKKQRADKTIDLITYHAGFEPGHIKKHIRSSIVKVYNKTPEDVLHDLSLNKDEELKDVPGVAGTGLGEPGTAAAIITVIASIAPAVPSIVNAFTKKDIPSSSDFSKPIPPNQNVTGDPAYGQGFSFSQFIQSPAGIITGVAVAGGVGYMVYNSKKTKK